MVDIAHPDDESRAVAAFENLGDRSQALLWYLLLDEEPVPDVAAVVGVAADSVPALSAVARHELRVSLVGQYEATAVDDECRRVLRWLVDFHADRLTDHARRCAAQHLVTCRGCAGAWRWTSDVGAVLEEAVLPAVLGPHAALRYIAARSR